MRLFSCGIESEDYQEKFRNLSDDDQKLLTRISERAWVTLILRYNLNIMEGGLSVKGGNFGLYQLTVNELPSIELFLLFSCLDTLAGQNHKQFPEWLAYQDINKKLSKEEIKLLYSDYLDEHGISRNLRNLFQNLPCETKSWLYKNVRISRSSENKTGLTQQVSIEKFIERLFSYYYFRRNSFTHQSKAISTNIANDIHNPDSDSWWLNNFPILLDKSKPNQKWEFKYRSGLDESTIMRVILHSVILQKLGIQTNNQLIKAHMLHLSRLNSFYAYKNEAISNTFYLESLSMLFDEEQFELLSRIQYNGMPLLNRMASINVTQYFNSEIPFERGMKEASKNYIRLVFSVNKIIIKFNQKLQDANEDNRLEVISNFTDHLLQESMVQEIINWPKTNTMRNLRFLILNPCYS